MSYKDLPWHARPESPMTSQALFRERINTGHIATFSNEVSAWAASLHGRTVYSLRDPSVDQDGWPTIYETLDDLVAAVVAKGLIR